MDRERTRKLGNKGKRKLKELEVKYRIKKLNIFLIDCNTGVKTDNDCKNCKNYDVWKENNLIQNRIIKFRAGCSKVIERDFWKEYELGEVSDAEVSKKFEANTWSDEKEHRRDEEWLNELKNENKHRK